LLPRVNADAVCGFVKKNITQSELLDRAARRRAEAAARQSGHQARSWSRPSNGLGRGKTPWTNCFRRPTAVYTNSGTDQQEIPQRIAFNVISEIDLFMEDGLPQGRVADDYGTKKILDPTIKLTATCVRVPVFADIRSRHDRIRKSYVARRVHRDTGHAPGLLVIDTHEPGSLRPPYEAAGEDATYISLHPRRPHRGHRPRVCGRLG